MKPCETCGNTYDKAFEVSIGGTSHWPQLDRPAEFNAILDEFLATVGASGGPSATAPADTL